MNNSIFVWGHEDYGGIIENNTEQKLHENVATVIHFVLYYLITIL